MRDRTVTTTATSEHGVGFVVPTLYFYQRGPNDPPGNCEILTCRDCVRTAEQGHSPDCPQHPRHSGARQGGVSDE
jgi:hypothetical protein